MVITRLDRDHNRERSHGGAGDRDWNQHSTLVEAGFGGVLYAGVHEDESVTVFVTDDAGATCDTTVTVVRAGRRIATRRQ